VLTPTPTQSDTFILRYIPVLTRLTADGDEMVIEDDFFEYVMHGISKYFEEWDENSFT